jgi:CRP-like cAMP-binding protein
MATAIVSPPPVLSLDSGVPLDNLQDLLKRKREIEKNKSKYHLTEADCSLILTNANEYSFKDGQVIMEEGHENSSVYRIKSGVVSLSKNGVVFCELSQGWFIGETLFFG